MQLLSGKTALIVGGSGMIGSATARLFAEHGASIGLHYFCNRDQATELSKEIRDLGRQCVVHQADITKTEESDRLVRETANELGCIDIMVNCAGIARDFTVQSMSEQDWDAVMEVNLFGPFSICKSVSSHMVKRGSGKIINLASVTGSTGQRLRTNYGASKGGLMGVTRSLAHQLAPAGIQVNAIAPQIIKGGLSATAAPDYVRETAKITPAGRLGSGLDVAGAALYLASAYADFIVGEVLFVTGGLVTYRV